VPVPRTVPSRFSQAAAAEETARVLERNMSAMFITAQLEIARKVEEIHGLRAL
jgi:hypothetical protein